MSAQQVGRDAMDYRRLVNLPPVDPFVRTHHEHMIHTLGADVLKSIFSDEHNEREKMQKHMFSRQVKAVSLIRKRVKVDDYDDGGLSVAIEQDWDTSGWSDTLIEAGMEALILIYYNLHGEATVPRKERALMMLQKLLDRHKEADVYLRKNVESLIAHSVSKYIRDGKAASVLDLLYVLNVTKPRLTIEMSNFSFASRLTEMMIQEARLAVILIQHTFRTMKAKKRLRATVWTDNHFGSVKDVYYRQLGVINARSSELRQTWRSFRHHYPPQVLGQVGGMRGPLHVGPVYVELALDIINHLVSDEAKLLAHSNREDVVRGEGCVLLSNFLGTPHSPFGGISSVILAEIAKVVVSFLPLLRTGVMYSAVQYLQYLRKVYRVGHAVLKEKRAVKVQLIRSFLATMEIMSHLALHAAGFYRARHGYDYHRTDSTGLEVTDYLEVLIRIEQLPLTDLDKDIVPLLVPKQLLSELSTQIRSASQPSVLNAAMRCLYYFASSECQPRVILEVTARYGQLMIRLVELLHHEVDHPTRLTTGNLALALFLQLSCTAETRKQLMTVSIPQHLVPLNQRYRQANSGLHLDSIEHLRGIYVAVALNRQDAWRYSDPEHLWVEVECGNNVHGATAVSHAQTKQRVAVWLRGRIMLDLLRTFKDENYDGFNAQLGIPDLVLLPADPHRALQVSKSAGSNLCALEIVHTLIHPHDPYYYESLPLHESVAVCQILESLGIYAHTGQMIFSAEVMHFVGKFLYLCKYLFLGKPMATTQVLVLLHGVKAAFLALGRLAVAVKDVRANAEIYCQSVQKNELVDTALFFLNILTTFQEKTDAEVVRLQKIVGISALAFFSKFADLLNVYEEHVQKLRESNLTGIPLHEQHNLKNNNLRTGIHDLRSSPTKNHMNAAEASERLSMCIEDLFPSGRIAVHIFSDLRGIIRQRHAQHLEQEQLKKLERGSQPQHQQHQRTGSVTDANMLRGPARRSLLRSSAIAQSPTKNPLNSPGSVSAQSASPSSSPSRRNRRRSVDFDSTTGGGQMNNTNNNNTKKGKDIFHHTTSTNRAHQLDPREEFLQVLDAMSQFLMSLTAVGRAGAYTAVQEWHIFDTLTKYLPPPLSGLNDVRDTALRSSIFAQTRASVAYSGGGSGPNSPANSPARKHRQQSISPEHAAMQATLRFFGAHGPPTPDSPKRKQSPQRTGSSVGFSVRPSSSGGGMKNSVSQPSEVDNDPHRLDLTDLPASFFSLCGNLCRVQEGAADCFNRGFLRRALDKAMHLYVDLLQHRHPVTGAIISSQKPPGYDMALANLDGLGAALQTSTFNWDFRKLDFISCLRVIQSCANFHSPSTGSANDLILSEPYDIVLVCKTLLKLKLRRTEEVVLVAYETLAALSKDSYRVQGLLEKHDVYEDIRQELLILTHRFPPRGALAAIQILHYSTQGLTSHYLAEMIPKLREPVIKVARIYPALDEAVRNAQWTLTKSAMLYRTTFDSSYQVEANDIVQVEIDTFIRTGATEGIQRLMSQDSEQLSTGRRSEAPLSGRPGSAQSTLLGAALLNNNQRNNNSGMGIANQRPFSLSININTSSGPSSSSSSFQSPSPKAARPGSASASTAQQTAHLLLQHSRPYLFHADILQKQPQQQQQQHQQEQQHQQQQQNRPPSASSSASSSPVKSSHGRRNRPDINAVFEEVRQADVPFVPTPGQYSYLGVTTQGSLHPAAEIVADEVAQPEVLPLSKLSARDSNLRDLVHGYKTKAGYAVPDESQLRPPSLHTPNKHDRHVLLHSSASSPAMMMMANMADEPVLTTVSTAQIPALMRTRPPPKPSAPTSSSPAQQPQSQQPHIMKKKTVGKQL